MIEVGKGVTLVAYNGQKIVRRVIERREDTIYVCTDHEYDKAHQEKREPTCVGFNVKYVLNDATP